MRDKRTREQKARAKGRAYGVGSELRKLTHRRTSSSIYENGKLAQEIKREISQPVPHYRFEGVQTENHWSIADIPAVWPDIEHLHKEKAALEDAEADAGRNRLLRGRVKRQRRAIENLATKIDATAMRQPD